jgi:hypothetical protein
MTIPLLFNETFTIPGNDLKHRRMKTQGNVTQHGNTDNGSLNTEGVNDESITLKVRQALEEWNTQERTCDLNKFRNPDANPSSGRKADN